MDLKTVISQVHWNSLQSNFTDCKMLLTPPSHKHLKKIIIIKKYMCKI